MAETSSLGLPGSRLCLTVAAGPSEKPNREAGTHCLSPLSGPGSHCRNPAEVRRGASVPSDDSLQAASQAQQSEGSRVAKWRLAGPACPGGGLHPKQLMACPWQVSLESSEHTGCLDLIHFLLLSQRGWRDGGNGGTLVSGLGIEEQEKQAGGSR